ncbi:MAG TPA: hypothetical protein VGY13_05535 [Solirubrobacteraceae bacterium]|jgi:hypothetical protein|nr:hypothetical protein [Solirubrobacteraceae bacterium]
MRAHRTTLTALAASGLLAAGAAGALAFRASAIRPAAGASSTHSWPLTLSAAPQDLALAEVAFPGAARGTRLSARVLRVSAIEPFGDDYEAGAVLAPTLGRDGPTALVLLVNRPSPLEDPADVHLRLLAARSLGAPRIRKLSNPLASAAAARSPLCALRLRGRALAGSQLSPLSSRGQPLAGFDAQEALAQAYDAGCGLPASSAFVRAVRSASGSPTPAPAPTPTPTPQPPQPPIGKLPGEGCVPSPGYACPE